jgi:hypothetical protein
MNQTMHKLNIRRTYQDNNTAHTLERFAREVVPMQHFRELFINAKESGATKIHVGYEKEAYRDLKVKRLAVKDNGKGMNPDEMLKYLCSHNSSSKSSTSGIHENFGIGAKATCLTWNKYGLVYISYSKANPNGSMIWLAYDQLTNKYGAVGIPVYLTDNGKVLRNKQGKPDEYIDNDNPVVSLLDLKLRYEDEGGFMGVKWWNIKPSQGKTGTIVICCGDNPNDSTFTHDSIGKFIHSREIQWYFMKRFSKLNNLLKVARGRASSHSSNTVQGLSEFLTNKHIRKESVKFSHDWSIDVFTTKTRFHDDKDRGGEFKTSELNAGMILIEYQGEFYHVKSSIKSLRSWGINQKDVARQTILVIKPPIYHEKKDGVFYGAFPNERRDALYFEGEHLHLNNQRSSDREKIIDVDWLKPLFDANKPKHLEEMLQESFHKKISSMPSELEKVLQEYSDEYKTLKRKRENVERIKACENGVLEYEANQASLARGSESTPKAQPEKEGSQTNEGSSQGSSNKPNNPKIGTPKGELKGKKTKVKDTTSLVKIIWKIHSDSDELEIEDTHNFKDSDTNIICPFDYSHSRATGILFANKDSELFREVAAHHAAKYIDGYKPDKFKGIMDIVKDVYQIKCLTMILHLRQHCQVKKLNINDFAKPFALYQQCLGLYNEADQIDRRIKALTYKKKAKK